MIVLHVSNRMERLTDHLFSEIRSSPPLPWESVLILPQNPTIGRWLTFRLADSQGVAMNVDTPLPGIWVREFLEEATGTPGEGVHFERNALFIRLLEQIPRLSGDPEFSEIRTYLQGGVPSLRLVGLADQLSELFDRAMLYRPDILTAWEDDLPAPSGWLRILWKSLAGPEKPSHFARLIRKFQSLERLPRDWERWLPDRLFLFGLSGIAPAMLDVIRRIGLETACQVHVFFLNPTDKYWADVVSLRTFRRMEEDLKSYFDPGHPLLAALGRTARDLHRMLEDWVREGEESGAIEVREDFEEPPTTTVLSRLQRGIFRMELACDPELSLREDGSLVVVSCLSPLREVETLRDFLLDRLSSDPAMSLEDIVVLSPRIEAYAPAIRAVFDSPDTGAGWSGPPLPLTLSDRILSAESPFFEGVCRLIQLPVRPLTASVFAMLLSFPEMSARLGIDRGTALSLVDTVVRGGFRWGLDEKDRKEGESREHHTLGWVVDRLLEGYCTGMVNRGSFLPVPPFVLPNDPQGERTGLLFSLFDRLRSWRERLREPRSLSGWADQFALLMAEFFETDPERHGFLLSIPEEIRGLCKNVHDIANIDCEMFVEILNRRFSRNAWHDRFFSGGITFGRMVPLRSIPFRVVCLLGMGEGEFPRNDPSQSFDFLRQDPRPLDRSIREDDLHLFLETLLSARSSLWISYVGVKKDEETVCLPSPPVRHLLESLGQAASPGGKEDLHRSVPSDPFDPSLFCAQSGILGSYSGARAEIAKNRLDTKETQGEPFVPDRGRLIPAGLRPKTQKTSGRMIPLSDLQSFFQNPPRFQARKLLGLALPEGMCSLSDHEPFVLTGSPFPDLFSTGPEDPARIPWPPLGPICLDQFRKERQDRWKELLEQFPDIFGDSVTDQRFSLMIGRFRLFGNARFFRKTGYAVWDRYPQKTYPDDILRVYLAHLAYSAGAAGYRSSLLFGWNSVFKPFEKSTGPLVWKADPGQAASVLRQFLGFFLKSRRRVFPFFPSVSLAYALERRKEKPRDACLHAARKKWEEIDPWGQGKEKKDGGARKDSLNHPGFFPYLFYGRDGGRKTGEWVDIPEFGLLAERIWNPVLDLLPWEKGRS